MYPADRGASPPLGINHFIFRIWWPDGGVSRLPRHRADGRACHSAFFRLVRTTSQVVTGRHHRSSPPVEAADDIRNLCQLSVRRIECLERFQRGAEIVAEEL